MSLRRSVFLQSINIAVFVIIVAVNSLAGATNLLNGKTSGQISDLYPTLVTPAGYTFSIWSVIYALLAVFVGYQALQRNRERPFLRQIGLLFALSGLMNVLWLFLWHYEFITISVPLMFGLLASLIAIYLRLGIGKQGISIKERICVHLPFSVYLGWITVASIANVSVALTFIGWDGGGLSPETWALLVIAVALFITLAVLATRKDAAYGLVIAWALGGIMAKQTANQNVVLMAEAGILVILIGIVAMAVVSRLKR